MKAALLWALWAPLHWLARWLCTWADAVQVELLLARADREIARRQRLAGKGARP